MTKLQRREYKQANQVRRARILSLAHNSIEPSDRSWWAKTIAAIQSGRWACGNIPLLILALLAAFAVPVRAQTVAPGPTNQPGSLSTNISVTPTNLLQALGAGSTLQQLASDFGAVFVDAKPYISNDIVQIDAGVLYNSTAVHHFGAFVDANVPTTQQLAVGFGGAYLDNTWLDATINLKLGSTFQWPVIGKVYGFIAEGPDYDFKTRTIGSYSFAGILKSWDISPKWIFSVNGAVGDISTFAGTCIEGGVSLNYHY